VRQTRAKAAFDDAGSLLFRLLHSLAIAEDGEVRCCGVTTAQGLALLTVGAAGQVTMSKVAEALGVSPGTATRVIDNLVRGGTVERTGDPADRRQVCVRPTSKGWKAIGQLNRCYARFSRAVFQGIPDKKVRGIREILALLVEAVERARNVCFAARRPARAQRRSGKR
jgi:DNA-binding MarR family transcriptional regulator